LNTDGESLPMTDTGSEFQTDGAAHRKERLRGWRPLKWQTMA